MTDSERATTQTGKSRADWPTITVKERPDAEQLAIKTRRRSHVVRNTTTDRAERAFRQSQSEDRGASAQLPPKIASLLQSTSPPKRTTRVRSTDTARLRPNPTTVQDTSVRDPDKPDGNPGAEHSRNNPDHQKPGIVDSTDRARPERAYPSERRSRIKPGIFGHATRGRLLIRVSKRFSSRSIQG